MKCVKTQTGHHIVQVPISLNISSLKFLISSIHFVWNLREILGLRCLVKRELDVMVHPHVFPAILLKIGGATL